MTFPYDEFDLSGVKTYPLASRQSKARAEDFARPYRRGDGLRGWLDGLPRILAAGDFRAVVERLVEARTLGRGHHLGLWRARAQDRPVACPGGL